MEPKVSRTVAIGVFCIVVIALDRIGPDMARFILICVFLGILIFKASTIQQMIYG